MIALGRVEDALRRRGCKKTGRDWQCPAHEDRTPSLSVSNGDGRALIHCHAGCSTEDILAGIGLGKADLFDEARSNTNGRRIIDWDHPVAVYVYTDEAGTPLLEVGKFGYADGPGKTFRQRLAGGKWKDGIGKTRRVLYRLPEVVQAVTAGDTIYIVEAEKPMVRNSSPWVAWV